MSDAQSVEARMSDAVEAMDRDFNHIRTGRASTSLVERIVVDYYGAQTPLNQLASISVPESTTLVIQPWDRGVLGAVRSRGSASGRRKRCERSMRPAPEPVRLPSRRRRRR